MSKTTVVALLLALCANSALAAYTWEWARDGWSACPNSAIQAGMLNDRRATYVSRLHHKKELIPGFSIESLTGDAYINYQNQTLSGNPYEMLCSKDAAWQYINASKHSIPASAIPVGYFADGTLLYSCRAPSLGFNGSYVSGIVDPETKFCNTTMDPTGDYSFNALIVSKEYDILIDVTVGQNEEEEDQFYWAWEAPLHPACPDDQAYVGATPGPVVTNAKYTRVHYGNALYGGFIPVDENTTSSYFPAEYWIRRSDTYEVLCGSGFAWLATTYFQEIPKNAVIVGQNETGSPLYGCMTLIYSGRGSFLPGVTHPASMYCATYDSDKNGEYTDVEYRGYYAILVKVST